MTVLSAISQKRYIVENDTIIAFNKYETRQIALMLVEGDKYKELYLNDSILLSKKDTIIANLRHIVTISDSTIQIQYTKLKYLNDENVKYKRALKRSKGGNIALGSALGVLGAITLYLLLK